MHEVNCIRCDKAIKADYEEQDEVTSPDNAVSFSGSGGFNTSGFDMSPTMFVVVCDDCLNERIEVHKSVYVAEVIVPAQEEVVDYTHASKHSYFSYSN